MVPTAAGHHAKLIVYTVIPTSKTMNCYASITDPVGQTAFIEETERKTSKTERVILQTAKRPERLTFIGGTSVSN